MGEDVKLWNGMNCVVCNKKLIGQRTKFCGIKCRNKYYYEIHKDERLERQREYYETHKEEKREYDKKYRETHKEEAREYRKRYCEEHKEERKEYDKDYYEAHREEKKEYSKNYYKTHKDKVNERERNRRSEDLNYKIARVLRERLRSALKSNQKVGSAVKDLGCTIQELKEFLEFKFYSNPETGEEMTWDNYGFYGWHIDHIIPLVSFDLIDRKQFLKACHYTNLQPMWAKENFSKGGRTRG